MSLIDYIKYIGIDVYTLRMIIINIINKGGFCLNINEVIRFYYHRDYIIIQFSNSHIKVNNKDIKAKYRKHKLEKLYELT
jgi:hypothetical protein